MENTYMHNACLFKFNNSFPFVMNIVQPRFLNQNKKKNPRPPTDQPLPNFQQTTNPPP